MFFSIFHLFFSPPPLSRRLAEQSALPAPEANVHSQFSLPLRTFTRTSHSRRSLQLPPFPLPPGAVPSGSLPFSSARRISFYRTSPRSSTLFFAFPDFFSRPARRARTIKPGHRTAVAPPATPSRCRWKCSLSVFRERCAVGHVAVSLSAKDQY